jgi:hypothetical protein
MRKKLVYFTFNFRFEVMNTRDLFGFKMGYSVVSLAMHEAPKQGDIVRLKYADYEKWAKETGLALDYVQKFCRVKQVYHIPADQHDSTANHMVTFVDLSVILK